LFLRLQLLDKFLGINKLLGKEKINSVDKDCSSKTFPPLEKSKKMCGSSITLPRNAGTAMVGAAGTVRQAGGSVKHTHIYDEHSPAKLIRILNHVTISNQKINVKSTCRNSTIPLRKYNNQNKLMLMRRATASV